MNCFARILILVCTFLFSVSFTSCGKKEEKVGKLAVTEKTFQIENDGNYSDSLNVKGKIRNIGSCDVKNIIVVGACKSCSESMISGNWFVTQDVKTEDQKAVIPYLPAGAEKDFSFKDIAFFYHKSGEKPQKFPDGLEVFVETFETVQE